MNILMATNTFTPHVGGVARSVESFTAAFRRLGHRVLVVAPDYPGAPRGEKDVIRLPAIQNFNGSDFSLALPIPAFLFPALEVFRPDVVHAHHPYLLGDTALRIAAVRDVPLVFTHHTMYERYTHYVPGDSPTLQRFVVELSTGYANLCDAVIAPSESVAALLRTRGVSARVAVIATGIDAARFAAGDGAAGRAAAGIPPGAFVVGHIGRLAPEKNLGFLATAVAAFLSMEGRARFLLSGVGPAEEEVGRIFRERGVEERLHRAGVLRGEDLPNAYHAMDVFVFASLSETQGIVLAEAMAAGVPVVAVDAPGVRDVVVDGRNGFLIPAASVRDFAEALRRIARSGPEARTRMKEEARRTAETLAMDRCVRKALELYESLAPAGRRGPPAGRSAWTVARRTIRQEWKLWSLRAHAAGVAIAGGEPGEP